MELNDDGKFKHNSTILNRALIADPHKTRVTRTLGHGAIVHSTNDARAQSLGVASIRSVQAEVHSVVGYASSLLLPPASPEAWNTFWDNLPSEQGPGPDQPAPTSRGPNKFEFLKVNTTANILSGPSASADIIGIAYAGAEV